MFFLNCRSKKDAAVSEIEDEEILDLSKKRSKPMTSHPATKKPKPASSSSSSAPSTSR